MPRPDFPKRTLTTIFLRVPPVDWPKVKLGTKTELRLVGPQVPYGLRPGISELPLPVAGYAWRRFGAPDAAFLVVERVWSERLIEIGNDSIRREGFESLDEFRRYWRKRQKKFQPLKEVVAMRLRPSDPTEAADMLLHRLYGFLLDDPGRTAGHAASDSADGVRGRDGRAAPAGH